MSEDVSSIERAVNSREYAFTTGELSIGMKLEFLYVYSNTRVGL